MDNRPKMIRDMPYQFVLNFLSNPEMERKICTISTTIQALLSLAIMHILVVMIVDIKGVTNICYIALTGSDLLRKTNYVTVLLAFQGS